MKAWAVRDTNYEVGMVVFAETRGKAHRLACSELDEEWTSVRVARAPSFDELAPGPVTQAQYLSRGWWVHCRCGGMVSDDGAVHVGAEAYCSRKCAARFEPGAVVLVDQAPQERPVSAGAAEVSREAAEGCCGGAGAHGGVS